MMAGIHMSVFLLSICLALTSAQNVINRDVTAQCYKSSRDNTLTTYFKSVLNGDDINYLYGLELMAGSSPEMYSKDTNCVSTDSNGVISMETVINLGDFTQTVSPCGVREVFSTADPTLVIGYTWRIALRHWVDSYAFWPDRDYAWTCSIDTATDTWLTTDVQVISPAPVILNPLTPTISFYVIRNGVDSAITSCEVGQLLQLQLKLYVSNWQELITPAGVYGYNTYVNWEANFNPGVADLLIGGDGCPISQNILKLDTTQNGGYTRFQVGLTGTNNLDLQFISRTGTFRCRKYPDKSMLHFVTTAAVCFGQYNPTGQSDVNCRNYCQFGPNQRRRRETFSQGNYTNIVTSIRVIDKEDKESESETGSGTTVLLIVAPIVGLLVVITSVIGVMLCCWMNRRNAMRKRRLESRASSDSSIPGKF